MNRNGWYTTETKWSTKKLVLKKVNEIWQDLWGWRDYTHIDNIKDVQWEHNYIYTLNFKDNNRILCTILCP